MVRKVTRMNDEEKKNLIIHLQNSLEPGGYTTVHERYAVLLAIAEGVFGHKMIPKKRSAEDVMIRRFVAYKLHEEGYSYHSIGYAMGLNHATIVYLVRQMGDYFSIPSMYREEIEKYKDFVSLSTEEQCEE